MVSQVLQLLRQGVWAALTGGWYHDPDQSKFTNSCHLYLWLFLLLLPLTLHLAFPPDAITTMFYCSSVTVFFTVIKFVSYRLHLMFDEGAVVQRRPAPNGERPARLGEAGRPRPRSAGRKHPSDARPAQGSRKEEVPGSILTPPIRCSSRGQSLRSQPSSGQAELPAQETVEDLKGVILSEDPAGAPGPPPSPGVETEAALDSQRCSGKAAPKPAAAGAALAGKRQERGGQRPPRHGCESGPGDGGGLRRAPHLSLSQSDLREASVAVQPWSSAGCVRLPAPGHCPQASVPTQSQSPQDSLSRSCPQCHSAVATPAGEPEGPPLGQEGHSSDGEVAVTLIDSSQPGEALSLQEPIRIVITMSSAPNSMTDLDSSLHLRVTGVDGAEPAAPGPAGQGRAPVVTLELSEDGGGGIARAQGESSPERRKPEGGRQGPASLDPSSCRGSHERRHARVLSVDSGTDVLLSRGPPDPASDKEKAMPTSKSDLEAKEGQVPNESNFLEFVSLIESISTSKAGPPQQTKGSAERSGDGGPPADQHTQGREEQTPDGEKACGQDSRPGNPAVPSPGPSPAPAPAPPPPARTAALLQGSRQRQIIYRVASQQDSSVLQVLSGPETSVQEEMSADARHVFIGEHGEIRACYLKSGPQKEGCLPHAPAGRASAPQVREAQASFSSSSTSDSPDPSSGDPAVSALQQQLLLMVAGRTQSGAPRHVSPDLEDSSCSSAQGKFNREQFYKFIIFPGKWIKVWYDRLTLLALLDRTDDVKENVLAVSLGVLVSLLGFLTLSRGFCKDLWALLFCLVMASCQYSLLKSVQPDPASPIHGHNQLITYSRPTYFCVLCGLILLLDAQAKARHPPSYSVYGLKLFSPEFLLAARDHLIVFLYCFPAMSLLGLFPQINTFCTYLLEQIDMLLFGGSAVSGMASAVYSVGRSVSAAVLLHALCFSAVKEPWSTQHIPALFSAFCGLLVALSYHLSRQSSDPTVLLSFIRCKLFPKFLHQNPEESAADPLPQKMKDSVKDVLRSDLIVCSVVAVLSFAISASTVFLSLRPFLSVVLYGLAGALGLLTHHLLPQLRKHQPWMCVSHPLLRSRECQQREVQDVAHLMWFERLYVWLQCFEKYILYPAIILNALTIDAFSISNYRRLGTHWDIFLMIMAGMKLLRTSFCNPVHQFINVGFAVLFFHFDYRGVSEGFLLDFFLVSILFSKLRDLLLKVQFVLAYVAPWQMAWGSSFHVCAQLFAIPHSAVLFFQAVATSVFSTPLSPFLGSVIFITSYVRPVKFWEKNYNTKRVDNSNTRLAVQIEKDPGGDDNNLNSIFYEHLTRALQEALCGDLALGRWGNYSAGDCFILASDDLNAFVHLIETGNGLVTFQLRGLEFRGTYCQQREVEAVTEAEEDRGCCCCSPGHLPHLLSCNAALRRRWLTWEVTRTRYVLEGYSIIDNNAATTLQVFDLRRILIRYYIKSIIYYMVASPRLPAWLSNESLLRSLQPFAKWHHIERDLAMFNMNIDDDYVPCLQGITRASFCNAYLEWIQYCARKRPEPSKSLDSDEDSPLVTLSFALCVLGRRALGTAAHNMAFSLDSFLHGLHALFKGDFRIAARDEWVFADMDLLHAVVAPAIRMALKLHQEQFTCPGEYEDPAALYAAIQAFQRKVVICHEGDPAWRSAVLANREELLTLRRVVDEGAEEYRVVMLHRGFLSFRVIKVNRECVRGLWASQQQELIFLRNRNPERGSIQNNTQVLRNLIGSSCDQPLGYPMFVSPLTTSFLGTHRQLSGVWGGRATWAGLRAWLRASCLSVRKDCSTGQRGGPNIEDPDGGGALSAGDGWESGADQPRKGGGQHWAPREAAQGAGRRKGRRQSVQTHPALSPRPPTLGPSGPVLEGRHPPLHTSTSVHELAQRPAGSRLSLHTSAASLHSQPPPAGATGQLSVRGRAEALVRSSLGSSTSSTLSLLFGKRSFSSALVISGLSAAEGGNTSDTQSSSSVNIAMGPSARAAGRAARHFSDPCEPATEQEQRPDRLAETPGVVCRRASQEDVGLDDTASQQSASDEQEPA